MRLIQYKAQIIKKRDKRQQKSRTAKKRITRERGEREKERQRENEKEENMNIIRCLLPSPLVGVINVDCLSALLFQFKMY